MYRVHYIHVLCEEAKEILSLLEKGDKGPLLIRTLVYSLSLSLSLSGTYLLTDRQSTVRAGERELEDSVSHKWIRALAVWGAISVLKLRRARNIADTWEHPAT